MKNPIFVVDVVFQVAGDFNDAWAWNISGKSQPAVPFLLKQWIVFCLLYFWIYRPIMDYCIKPTCKLLLIRRTNCPKKVNNTFASWYNTKNRLLRAINRMHQKCPYVWVTSGTGSSSFFCWMLRRRDIFMHFHGVQLIVLPQGCSGDIHYTFFPFIYLVLVHIQEMYNMNHIYPEMQELERFSCT